jgi:hypothetical protein
MEGNLQIHNVDLLAELDDLCDDFDNDVQIESSIFIIENKQNVNTPVINIAENANAKHAQTFESQTSSLASSPTHSTKKSPNSQTKIKSPTTTTSLNSRPSKSSSLKSKPKRPMTYAEKFAVSLKKPSLNQTQESRVEEEKKESYSSDALNDDENNFNNSDEYKKDSQKNRNNYSFEIDSPPVNADNDHNTNNWDDMTEEHQFYASICNPQLPTSLTSLTLQQSSESKLSSPTSNTSPPPVSKPKMAQYKKYSLKDYRHLPSAVVLGTLGPDIDEAEVAQRKLKEQMLKLRAAEIRVANAQKAPKQPPPKQISVEESEEKKRRQKALEYAKQVPKPKVIVKPLSESLKNPDKKISNTRRRSIEDDNGMDELSIMVAQQMKDREEVNKIKSSLHI